MTISKNKLNQKNDIAGSRNQYSSLDVANEPNKLGQPIAGQSGSAASISGLAPDMVITGLSGLTAASECNFLTISGASLAVNNGTFLIKEVLNSTNAVINNPFGVSFDSNNGSISWIERESYSLEDDLNYERSDRSNIKGVDYFEPVPKYVRCIDQNTEIDANLANIAGNTTDAKAFVDNIKYFSLTVNTNDSFITLSNPGELKHANSTNITGVPVNDGYDASNDEATFVGILNADGYESELTVLSDQFFAEQGWRIFGRTRAGSSISPNSVEIEFRASPPGDPISGSVPYLWESGQPNLINVIIGYRSCLNNLDEAALRKLLIFGNIYGGTSSGGGVGGGINENEHASLRQLVHLADGVGGPFEEFATGAYREVDGQPFPTKVTWYEAQDKAEKIVQKLILRDNKQCPRYIVWKAYDEGGSNIVATVIDSIFYSGPFETSRIRRLYTEDQVCLPVLNDNLEWLQNEQGDFLVVSEP